MKKLLLFAVVLMALPAFGQHKRRVLVEEFTQASCPPCASQNPAFNAKLDQMNDLVTPLKYQTSWPGVDPMNQHNPGEVATRVAYYEVSGVPNAFLNGIGVADDCGAYDNAPACMDTSEVRAAYDELTPVTINLSHTLSADFSTIQVTVSVTSDAALSGPLRLHVACTEPEIIFGAAPGTNGELEFFDVMKKMLPNAEGTLTGNFTAGETKTFSFEYSPSYYYDLNQIGVVAWLQDNTTKEVFQSAKADPNVVIPGGNIARVSLSTNNASKLICTNSYTLPFTLRNLSTSALTTAEIKYRVGTGAEQTYNWTGSLAANSSTLVNLAGVTAAQSGGNNVVIRVTNTNNGIQTNQVDGAVTAVMNAMYQLKPTPYTYDFEAGGYPAEFGTKNDAASGLGWASTGAAGAFGASDRSIFCDFYNLLANRTAETYLPRIDMTGAISAKLSFDHAYTGYDATSKDDRLRIDVSKDCGATWTTLFDKQGDALATAPLSQPVFVPTATQWESNEVDLVSMLNEPSVLIRLRGTSDYGNRLYIDNINVDVETSSVTDVDALTNFKIVPNPAADRANIQFSLNATENLQLRVYAMDGTLVRSQNLGQLASGQHNVALDATTLSNGSYRVTLQSNTGVSQLQWIVLH
jgi:Outer membrane protein Omp28/Secretion system C-terminal sorting domain